ncbi:hypothetical protein LEP1GSC133_4607 [Leptospira borgpetersenii serovar Pomona str. 200901868]|uniref:Uncharacterized protein n=1 Tax=Leptospira borgpetersenii serovar Pomona str. 200901868 TaxID=1192866 RepID=M6W3N6_LEPBO|nr:hypothetical protein LEP1GSC133_4607 [Leptospira borgpetersenii serovar Pomona str. 200901868]
MRILEYFNYFAIFFLHEFLVVILFFLRTTILKICLKICRM